MMEEGTVVNWCKEGGGGGESEGGLHGKARG